MLQFSGEAPYSLQTVGSTDSNPDPIVFPVTFGPFGIEAGKVIGLYEFDTYIEGAGPEVTFEIRLRNLSGGANLGFSVYVRDDEAGFYNKGEARVLIDGNGAGQDEVAEVTLPADAYLGLVVWKNNHEDLGLNSTFELQFVDPTTVSVPGDGDLPTVSRIESVYPNPFNPQTTVRLALRQAGHAAVKVYNVQGRLVRTLVDAELPAGRHELRWNGVDDSGRQVPSGVYLVRAVHADGVDRQRMSLIK